VCVCVCVCLLLLKHIQFCQVTRRINTHTKNQQIIRMMALNMSKEQNNIRAEVTFKWFCFQAQIFKLGSCYKLGTNTMCMVLKKVNYHK